MKVNFLRGYLQWYFDLLNYLRAVWLFDEDVEQSNILFHVLENLLLESVHPGLIPGISRNFQKFPIKDMKARLTSKHFGHIKTDFLVVILQYFFPGCILARSTQLSEIAYSEQYRIRDYT